MRCDAVAGIACRPADALVPGGAARGVATPGDGGVDAAGDACAGEAAAAGGAAVWPGCHRAYRHPTRHCRRFLMDCMAVVGRLQRAPMLGGAGLVPGVLVHRSSCSEWLGQGRARRIIAVALPASDSAGTARPARSHGAGTVSVAAVVRWHRCARMVGRQAPTAGADRDAHVHCPGGFAVTARACCRGMRAAATAMALAPPSALWDGATLECTVLCSAVAAVPSRSLLSVALEAGWPV